VLRLRFRRELYTAGFNLFRPRLELLLAELHRLGGPFRAVLVAIVRMGLIGALVAVDEQSLHQQVSSLATPVLRSQRKLRRSG
jgi:hypothetical protein